MTTLSKEDVVRMAEQLGLKTVGDVWNMMRDGDDLWYSVIRLHEFATLARADLVAENERLKAEVKLLNDEKSWRYVEQILSPIRRLLEVAGAAEDMADNSEEIQKEDSLALIVQRTDFDKLSNALDLLDDLPDDKPGYVLGGAAKAAWSLRDIIGDANG